MDIYLLLQSFLFIKNLLACGTTMLETSIASKVLQNLFSFLYFTNKFGFNEKIQAQPRNQTSEEPSKKPKQISANGATSSKGYRRIVTKAWKEKGAKCSWDQHKQ